jgi:hypothetical protein
MLLTAIITITAILNEFLIDGEESGTVRASWPTKSPLSRRGHVKQDA